jgi:hypothetical protein
MLAGLAPASPASLGNQRGAIASRPPAGDSGEVMPERRKPNRKALNVRLDPDVIARLKRVARDAAGKPCYASVAGIVEAGIIAECDRIEAILRAAYVTPIEPASSRPVGRRGLGQNDNHTVRSP